MSTTKSPVTSVALRTHQLEQFPPDGSRTGSAGDFLSRGMDTSIPMLNRPRETCGLTGTGVDPGEFHEFRACEEFLERHVRPDCVRDVQCMLLWNEWVRTFCRTTRGFPKLILEKEFRDVITGKFGTGISDDGFRGAIYPGIRFVP